MSTDVGSNQDGDQRDESQSLLLKGLLSLRRSFILSAAVVGVILIAIGASPLVTGVYAGMFGVWGATLLICAGLGFVGVIILRMFDN